MKGKKIECIIFKLLEKKIFSTQKEMRKERERNMEIEEQGEITK